MHVLAYLKTSNLLEITGWAICCYDETVILDVSSFCSLYSLHFKKMLSMFFFTIAQTQLASMCYCTHIYVIIIVGRIDRIS